MAETKLIRGMELRPQGTSVTVPSGPLTYNIPIVYYCVCETASNTLQKVATWLGVLENDGTTKNVKAKASNSGDKFRLYEGVTVAVYFTKGCDSLSGTITLRIDDKDAKPIVLNDNSSTDSFGKSKNKFTGCNRGDVMVFIYDGERFKVANGIDSGTINLIKQKIAEFDNKLDGLEEWTVKRPGYDPSKGIEEQSGTPGGIGQDGLTLIYIDDDGVAKKSNQNKGNENQFIYLKGGKITEPTTTIGGTSIPIWIENGIIKKISGKIGEKDKPVYINQNGAITASSATIGKGTTGDPIPIWMDSGQLKAFEASLGGNKKPIYLNSGVFKAVNKDLATEEYVSSVVPTQLVITHDNPKNEYQYTFRFKDNNNNELFSNSIDLPLEYLIGNVYPGEKDGKRGLYFEFKIDGQQKKDPIFIELDSLTEGFVKDNTNAHGNSTPVYVDTNGTIQKFSMTDYAKKTDIGNATLKLEATAGTFNATNFHNKTFTANSSSGVTATLKIPSSSSHLTDSANLIRRSTTTAIGSSTQPVYIDGEGYVKPANTIPSYGLVTKDSKGLAPALPQTGGSGMYLRGDGTWATLPAAANYYHSGEQTAAATSALSALKASWSNAGTSGGPTLSIKIPIYWGSNAPSGTSTTGALFIQTIS